MRLLLVLSMAGSLTSPSEVQAAATLFRVSYPIDGALVGVGYLGTALVGMAPVDATRRWESELLPIDEGVKQNFSARAAALSDAYMLSAIVVPAASQLAFGFDERLGQATLLYAQALGGNWLITGVVKHIVQRPRPYAYHPDPRVQAYTQAQGKDSRLSFYSGHASTAFTAAVAGAYLFAVSAKSEGARATMWALELALATATANMRVRAGKHFYSDVILGAIMGIGVGIVVPYLHLERPGRYTPSWVEWSAMAGGILVGAIGSQLMKAPSNLSAPLADGPPALSLYLSPFALEGGGGLAIGIGL